MPPTEGEAPAVSEVKVEVPQLSPPAPFKLQGQHRPDRDQRYAGYAGLIAANGGLEPSEISWFFKNHGFKVKLTVSEDESWSELNEGKIAGSVTTVDVLAAYGRQLHAVVPAQIGFSRGADGVIVRKRHQADQSAEGQDDRRGAVHRSGLLHPLPGAGSRAGRSTRSAASTRRRIRSG